MVKSLQSAPFWKWDNPSLQTKCLGPVICDSHVSPFQERCHIKIDLKIIMVYRDEMYLIILHEREQWYD